MNTKWQFKNFTSQNIIEEDITDVSTVILPNVTLSVRHEWFVPSTPPMLEIPTIMDLPESMDVSIPVQAVVSRKKKLLRNIVPILTLVLGLAIYFIWHSMSATAAPPAVLQQNYSNTSTVPTVGTTTNTDTGQIVVYILGAITKPGIYNLSADARVYQLVQAAGGLLPNANAVALNMAAKLTDGEEVYVLTVGEIAPPGTNAPAGSTNGTPSTLAPGQLVNINTASEADLRQTLHISATTAQKIIAYRTQHGPYTSVSQLLQVVSQSIYARIKDMVTV
ncbi:MAG: ComEA family DNA-binding protein [Ktedonobacteraceae bacterium]